MKGYHRIINSLTFRVIAPIAVIMLIISAIMYLFVLTTVSDFVNTHIKGDITEMSRNIYNTCDKNLDELLRAGLIDDERAVRIKKGLTIGAIEDFMRANNLKGFIIEDDREALNTGNIPLGLLTIIKKNEKENVVLPIEYGGERHYAHRIEFSPWKWNIVLLKNVVAYSKLKNKVNLAYAVTGGILSIAALLLFYYLNRAIEYPISRIITPIKRGEQPEYKGIYEFEFLSNSINEMMVQKQRLMKQIIEEQKLEGVRILAAGVAHNFNNILVGILGYASLVRMKLEEAKKANQPVQGELVDELIRHMHTIENSVQKAGGLAKELTSLSRKRKIEKDSTAPISINNMIQELQKLLVNTFPKNIEIIADISEGLPLIKGDASQLEQALLNICINSKDAMPNGGKLIMKAFVTDVVDGNSKYHYLKDGKYITIQISDTGIGMDEATLSHIFDPFFTTKPVDKGTGLGLTTVYSIIKAHNGYVIADSLPNKGSTFTIYLPIEERNPKL